MPRPLLFAHRGASARAPENTLEAFELALEVGADVLELDVQSSSDSRLFVVHDPTLERTTNGTGPVARMASRELLELDAGFRFDPRGGQAFPFRGRGIRIPTLSEVVAAFPQACFNIELKCDGDEHVRTLLADLAPLSPEQVVLTAGDPRIMARLEGAQSPHPLGMSYRDIKEVLTRVWTGRSIEHFAGRALQLPPFHGICPVATGPVLRAARRAGLEVHLWTLNDAGSARRWLAKGVDGIMSDDPGALAPVFAEASLQNERAASAVVPRRPHG